MTPEDEAKQQIRLAWIKLIGINLVFMCLAYPIFSPWHDSNLIHEIWYMKTGLRAVILIYPLFVLWNSGDFVRHLFEKIPLAILGTVCSATSLSGWLLFNFEYSEFYTLRFA